MPRRDAFLRITPRRGRYDHAASASRVLPLRAVSFSVASHTPVPYQLCSCSICRKTAGGGGYAINIMGTADSLSVSGRAAIGIYRAVIADQDGHCRTSAGQRHSCTKCASALWLWDETWPDRIHPFASAIDSNLPVAPERIHLMLRDKPDWVEPRIGPRDQCFDLYPDQSIAEWHKSRGLRID